MRGGRQGLRQGASDNTFLHYLAIGLNTFSAVFLYRVGSALYDKGMPWNTLAKLTSKYNYWWNSCEIRPTGEIGPGFHVPTPNRRPYWAVSAGRNLIVHQNASLVLKDRRSPLFGPRAFPSFGDNVIVGPNASVLGGVVIGDDVMIGAGAVVHTDVAAGCRAVGNPARITLPSNLAPGTQTSRGIRAIRCGKLRRTTNVPGSRRRS